MTFPFHVAVNPALPAETTISCPDDETLDAVRFWLDGQDGTPNPNLTVYRAGEEVPESVAAHVVAP
jgi:hypothetical protein